MCPLGEQWLPVRVSGLDVPWGLFWGYMFPYPFQLPIATDTSNPIFLPPAKAYSLTSFSYPLVFSSLPTPTMVTKVHRRLNPTPSTHTILSSGPSFLISLTISLSSWIQAAWNVGPAQLCQGHSLTMSSAEGPVIPSCLAVKAGSCTWASRQWGKIQPPLPSHQAPTCEGQLSGGRSPF